VNKILVGTKCDLESRREVTSEEGKGLAKEYNIPFIETSAKEGTNVEEAFLTIATAVKDRLIADGFVPGGQKLSNITHFKSDEKEKGVINKLFSYFRNTNDKETTTSQPVVSAATPKETERKDKTPLILSEEQSKPLGSGTSETITSDLVKKEEKLCVDLAEPINNNDETGNDDEKYLKEALAQGKKEWRRSKIMIVGEGRAGKTALANSILGRAYENLDSTIGINEFTCSIGYASVGEGEVGGKGTNQKNWKESMDEKTLQELERAVASMIFHMGKLDKDSTTGLLFDEEEVDEMMKKLKGGYLEGEGQGIESEGVILESANSNEVPITELNAREDSSDDSELKENGKKEINELLKRCDEYLANERELPENHSHRSEIDTAIDSSLVMKYLGEQSQSESKFIISVFDFGGQSVFNVIHPFFLTRFGVYVITFNMEWLSSSAEATVREECIRYMSFWLNSVIIHTQNEKGQVAPVVFVGTRKDLITSPAEHQAISTSLYNIFCRSIAWPYVIENNGAEGPYGKADLCFFPVNNKLGNDDPTVRKLLQLIEKSIDNSSYVHVERPLSWFQVLDIFKSKNVPYLEYSEVESIIVSCNIPKDRVPTLLRFFHEMGILMWHDEEGLRDIIVFDPIEYFVKPATTVICKHVPNQSDGIYHSTKLHKEVRKRFPVEFSEMIQHGIVSETLLAALLEEHSENYECVKKLMIKYGLLVPLIFAQLEKGEDRRHSPLSGKGGEEELFLVPALLHECTDKHRIQPEEHIHSFHFIFSTSKILKQKSIFSLGDCNKLGFLPSGLFEKLISKAMSWSMTTSNYVSRENLYHCFNNSAELAFGNQRFVMRVDYYHNLITIHVLEGNNPPSIHDRLRDQIQEIVCESFKSLTFSSLLEYEFRDHQENNKMKMNDPSTLSLIRLEQIIYLVEEKLSFPIVTETGIRHTLTFTEVLQLYSSWLTDFLSLNEFDLFLSYRWGRYDSHFTQALFDRLSLHAVDESMRTIRTFLDIKRLKAGENYQMKLVNALSKSLLIIPIVSSDALQKMITLKSTDEDNLLLEWICGLELMKHHQNHCNQAGSTSRLMKFMPIFFGTRVDENNIKNFFQEDILSKLPTTPPTACLELSEKLLLKAGITMSSEMRNATIKEIVTEVTKYLFLCAWESTNSHELTIQAANKIVTNLNECLQEEEQQHQTRVIPLTQPPQLRPHSEDITLSSSSSVPDCEAAWSLLNNPSRSTDFSALSQFLSDIGVICATDLEFLLDDPELFDKIASFLKVIPQKQFRAIFSKKKE
jgi:GTPase SAR1 family protein